MGITGLQDVGLATPVVLCFSLHTQASSKLVAVPVTNPNLGLLGVCALVKGQGMSGAQFVLLVPPL